MNARLDPVKEMIFSPDQMRECFVDELPERRGVVYLGLDAGEATIRHGRLCNLAGDRAVRVLDGVW